MIESGQNFGRVVTDNLSWHVQICDLIVSLELMHREFSQNSGYTLMK